MVIATPLKNQDAYYNQKLNCMAASGIVSIGETEYIFNKRICSGTWLGRGIWTYSNTWYWSSPNTYVDGESFGFNLGYGFGDIRRNRKYAVLQGNAHKLDQVDFGYQPKMAKMITMVFGILPAMTIVLLYALNRLLIKLVAPIKLIKSDQHQVFGRFYGDCILDDGTIITLTGQIGFAEKVSNKW